MKIAVLSDIHANLMSLKLALKSLENENVDKIAFLGDYITDGENENEILDIIKKYSDYAIAGNREEYILNYSPERKDYNNYKTIHTTYNNLSSESKDYLKSLPKTLTIQINGFKILILHGNQYRYNSQNIEELFDKIIADFDFDICLYGHTHRYLCKEYKNKLFLNPGATGIPVDTPSYKYCILEITDKVSVTLKEIATKDSFQELASVYRKTAYYKANQAWATLILYTIRDGIDYCPMFLELFNEQIKNKEDLSSTEFNKIWDETFEAFCNEYKLERKEEDNARDRIKI